MKKGKVILIGVLMIVVSFCVYGQYIKMKFDKIYEDRENYGANYNEIYTSGKLEVIKPFLFEHFDATITATKGASSRRVNLSNIADLTKDSLVLSAADYLIEKGFYRIELIFKNGVRDELRISGTFLHYKHVPTRHHLIFSENFKYKYRFAPNDKWFFYSSDEEPHDGPLPDFRPLWTVPYFEAFTFFW